ncbi:MAG TPA: NADPH:quinone reductase [Burkholderiaceae bacterium]|nr:NADPH:quinone reductase [Burkholderiaceae bacterium]
MKAIAYTQTGPAADVLKLIDLPTPEPGAGEVRVKVQWSGVNPSDVKSRLGLRSKTLAFPQITPHSDGAGVIDAVGTGVPASRVGERVWIWNGQWQRPFGTAAQYIVLPAAQAVPLPDGVSGEAGACLGIPALTALQGVLVGAGVAGRRVLVAGGAGAVGHYAVQFARRLGASQVVATVSSEAKARIALDAGADATIDYKRDEMPVRAAALTCGKGFDRIIEVDAAANIVADLAMLSAGGDVAIYGSGAPDVPLPFFPAIVKNATLHCYIVYNLSPADRERTLATLQPILARGELKHQIAERLPLAECARAHQLVESGKAVGNVVLQVD